MKYCVMADLHFDIPAKRDQMTQALKEKLVGKLTWGKVVVSEGLSMEGLLSNVVEVRFDAEADMNELYALIKDRMEKLPILKGRVSKHPCSHDGGNESCVLSEEYIKV